MMLVFQLFPNLSEEPDAKANPDVLPLSPKLSAVAEIGIPRPRPERLAGLGELGPPARYSLLRRLRDLTVLSQLSTAML